MVASKKRATAISDLDGDLSTKDRVLHMAVRMFNRQGTSAVTTNHIAAELGMSPGNLYYHYRNKEDVVRAAFDAMNDEADALWEKPFGPAGIDVARLLEGNLRLFERYAFFARELPSLLHADETLRKRYQNIAHRRRAEVEKALAWMCESQMMKDPGEEARGRLVDACWVFSLNWLGYAEISGEKIGAASVRRGGQIVLEILRPHLVPGIHALMMGVISVWKPR
ncbi:MAG: TetR/AcrR family transcriptional regulator [Polyangiaceae bacterium]